MNRKKTIHQLTKDCAAFIGRIKDMKIMLVVLALIPVSYSLSIEKPENDVVKHVGPVASHEPSNQFKMEIHTTDIYQGSPGPKGEKGDKGDRGPSGGGAVYTRWGRTVCPDTTGTELVYEGIVASSHYNQYGGGASYLCATKKPKYLKPKVAGFSLLSYIYGTEYELIGYIDSRHNQNAPCAVCHTSVRSSKLMIPGTTACPLTWTAEYTGYLMSERSNANHKHSTAYECVDDEFEGIPGQEKNEDNSLFYLVVAMCNTGLPCPPYEADRPIACVVCTK